MCEWCAAQKRRCAGTEEGSKKRKGVRPGTREKGKGKEKRKGKVVEGLEETEVVTEVRRLSGLVGKMRGELNELSQGYQKMRREMRE